MEGAMRVAVCLAGVAVAAGGAGADIVYDNISTNSWHSSIFSEDEYADDTMLSTGAGGVIQRVEVGVLRSFAFPGAYSGTMTVRLWSDAGGVPGSLLGTAAVPIVLSDDVPHIVGAAFPGIIAPTATIWTGVQFTFVSQLGAGIVEGIVPPSVGTSTGLRARRQNNTWSAFNVGSSNEFIRIDTVPAPASGVVVGAGVLAWARRRRAAGGS